MQTINVGGKELSDAIFQVLRRASVDPEFRALAAKDGRAAIEKINPKAADSASEVDVRFLDQSNTNPVRVLMTFVLPEPASVGELSEEELEQVAGGGVQAHAVDIQKLADD
jgi:hypothetical protein